MSFCKDCRDCFGSTDLYFILQISPTEKTNLTNAKIKKAYYKQSMLWHPDRFNDTDKKARAMKRFQVISKAYTFLSDPEKRKNYDSTGIVEEESVISLTEGWREIWNTIFEPVTQRRIQTYLRKYIGSAEQRMDVITTYNKFNGDMDKILECVIGAEDEEQIRFMINDLIVNGELEPLPDYIDEPESKRKAREQKRQKEARAVSKQVQKLKQETGRTNNNFDLFTAMRELNKKREAESEAFFLYLEEKYCTKTSKIKSLTEPVKKPLKPE